MFIVTKSHKKNFQLNVIHMCIIAISIYSAIICLLSVSDLFLFLTTATSFYAFLITQWFVLLVLNIIHVPDLESNSDSTHLYNFT
jgi:hypothetical protein